MKKQKAAIKGPKVRYFQHSIGVAHAKQSRLKFGASVCMSITLFAFVGVGFSQYRSHNIAARAAQPAVASQTPVQDQPKQKEAPKQAREDQDLAKKINKKIAEMPKGTKWSVSVRDLNSERMANVNADQGHDAADLAKLFMLAPLEAKLPATSWSSHLNKQTISGCVEAMIKQAENDCGSAIGNYAGWKNIDPVNQGLGFSKTKISSAKDQKTTSREVSDLMYRFQNSQVLSDKARRVVFDGLYEQKQRDGIAKGCGVECLVGSKAGETDKVRHDAAVVTHGQAKYVVVIMSSGGSWQQIADVEHVIDNLMLP